MSGAPFPDNALDAAFAMVGRTGYYHPRAVAEREQRESKYQKLRAEVERVGSLNSPGLRHNLYRDHHRHAVSCHRCGQTWTELALAADRINQSTSEDCVLSIDLEAPA